MINSQLQAVVTLIAQSEKTGLQLEWPSSTPRAPSFRNRRLMAKKARPISQQASVKQSARKSAISLAAVVQPVNYSLQHLSVRRGQGRKQRQKVQVPKMRIELFESLVSSKRQKRGHQLQRERYGNCCTALKFDSLLVQGLR